MQRVLIFAGIVIAGAVIAAKGEKKIRAGLLVIYILGLIYFTFLTREPMPIRHYSLDFLNEARRGIEIGGGVLSGLIHGDVRITNGAELQNIILNILLFVPFGYLLPSLFSRLRWWQGVFFGVAGSFVVEIAQLITRRGYADVDDLINNTIGAAIGVLVWNLFIKKHEQR